ncbi:unnamed protein product [Protopolystoma xenopodis]|uniref:Uncharacterized protein n=1 Tax=Protopolystoma xenopodis TaxID=117903 RepID=A0A3S5BB71_9PLAT|nr:unnamed protein product [Protopolystoma xenopodis]
MEDFGIEFADVKSTADPTGLVSEIKEKSLLLPKESNIMEAKHPISQDLFFRLVNNPAREELHLDNRLLPDCTVFIHTCTDDQAPTQMNKHMHMYAIAHKHFCVWAKCLLEA